MYLSKFSKRDHPRIRGEHSTVYQATHLPMGSSPHTRGALGTTAIRANASRIIPAYAGSTQFVHSFRYVVEDHPRIRGEHVLDSLSNAIPIGSSPHTRGAQAFQLDGRLTWGIIPAYAGSTQFYALDLGRMGDHPRIRGEHNSPEHQENRYLGSSPHTRGAPVRFMKA